MAISESGLEIVVSGVGVGAWSLRIAGRVVLDHEDEEEDSRMKRNVQATERLDGSVYFVLLGRGDAGRLGIS